MAYKKPSKRRQDKAVELSSDGNFFGIIPAEQDFGVAVKEEDVKKQCKAVIGKALEKSLGIIQFEHLPDSTQGFEGLFCRDMTAASEFSDGPKNTPLVKWFELQNTTIYWIGFRLGFRRVPHRSGRYISTVSLMVARSFAGSNPEATLRAEWAYWAPENITEEERKEKETKHAQPHWHVYSSNLNSQKSNPNLEILQNDSVDDDELISEFDPNMTISTPSPNSSEDRDSIGDFHFAMCAHWSRDYSIVQWPISELELAHWLKHCLAYIRSQLDPNYKN